LIKFLIKIKNSFFCELKPHPNPPLTGEGIGRIRKRRMNNSSPYPAPKGKNILLFDKKMYEKSE